MPHANLVLNSAGGSAVEARRLFLMIRPSIQFSRALAYVNTGTPSSPDRCFQAIEFVVIYAGLAQLLLEMPMNDDLNIHANVQEVWALQPFDSGA